MSFHGRVVKQKIGAIYVAGPTKRAKSTAKVQHFFDCTSVFENLAEFLLYFNSNAFLTKITFIMQNFFLSAFAFIALTTLATGSSIAQPVLPSNISLPLGQHVPVVGVVESSVPNQGASGANITWDF